jgi:hypothetical protein
MNLIADLIQEVGHWRALEVTPHRFGGFEIRWGKVEIGHMHTNGMVDIPFSRKTWDAHIRQGLAGEHHLLKDSGWVTSFLRSETDMLRVRDLLRLSLLIKRVRRSKMEAEAQELVDLRGTLGLKNLTV